ncbi:hypothetical protein KC343_g12106 [Hortaea werneckii]|nr:hypothetical protein KC352_g23030 [Hortaea werneckii]KAI7560676.1 hypothetical protein KC317_g9577 [Hortaea werneckii]KAI7609296.1 hypothetical protein KC346_g9255 [Hortaea werneckii]KAI7609971.1 hypothetical protein KC343_g12106 [Hortaea werneckii]KAI7653991.1 hypothetical protein KC319_g10375 [Hortaea werneckii]
MKAVQILATALGMSTTAIAESSWTCAASGGPGADRVAEAAFYYANIFGAGTNTVRSLFSQGVRCNGVSLYALNVVGYDTEDTPEKRHKAVNAASQIDGNTCSWSGHTAQDYQYGTEDAFTCASAGGIYSAACCITDCEGNVVVGTGCADSSM